MPDLQHSLANRSLLQENEQLREQMQNLQFQLEQVKQRIEQNNQQNAQANTSRDDPYVTNNDINVVNPPGTLKLAPFWKTKPQLWFLQTEATFRRRNMRSDASKYDAVVEILDETAISKVSDILSNPPAEDKYEYLKENLIKRFTDSSERQLHKLLSETSLGDKKPSQLLRSMRDLANGQAADDLLKTKWLGLLPTNVRNPLKVARKADLTELADIADSIMENYNENSGVLAVTIGQPTQNSQKKQEKNNLEERIDKVEKHLAQLASSLRRSPSNDRSRSRSRGHSRFNYHENGTCGYHIVFKEKANNCIPPCLKQLPASTQGN